MGYSRKDDVKIMIYTKDEENIKIAANSKYVICCTQDRALLRQCVKEIVEYLRMEKARVGLKDDIIKIEEA